jgi:hypothetical protein
MRGSGAWPCSGFRVCCHSDKGVKRVAWGPVQGFGFRVWVLAFGFGFRVQGLCQHPAWSASELACPSRRIGLVVLAVRAVHVIPEGLCVRLHGRLITLFFDLICLPYMSASYVWCSPPRPSYHLVLLYCCTLAPSTETLLYTCSVYRDAGRSTYVDVRTSETHVDVRTSETHVRDAGRSTYVDVRT